MIRLLFLFLGLAHLSLTSEAGSVHGTDFNENDFVVALPSCVHRLPLAQASRLWRHATRAFYVLNNTELADKLNEDPVSVEQLESHGYWEDDSHQNGTWRGGNIGDTRAALTPWLAHLYYGDTYKWMLYGDDDTVYYMTGVLELLKDFDPNMPLAISDNLWHLQKHPNDQAPRCLPCHFNLSHLDTSKLDGFIPRPACPFCTRALACGTYSEDYHCTDAHHHHYAHDPHTRAPGHTWEINEVQQQHLQQEQEAAGSSSSSSIRQTADSYFQWMLYMLKLKKRGTRDGSPADDWNMMRTSQPNPVITNDGSRQQGTQKQSQSSQKRLPSAFCAKHQEGLSSKKPKECIAGSSAHGGAGIIFSIGLMRMLPPEVAVEYILTLHGCGGGDCLLAKALWHFGIGYTDPGSALRHHNVMYSHFVDSNAQRQGIYILADPLHWVSTPNSRKHKCRNDCKWLVQNVVATHVRARAHDGNVTQTVAGIQRHVTLHDQAYEYLRQINWTSGG